nr:hypothetical protein CFP56_07033 [Quercus suber]
MSCLETSLSDNSVQHHIRKSSPRSSSLGHHHQSMVEVPHEHSKGFMGSGKGAKQVAKAISDVSLGQIKVAHSGEESSGLQQISINTYRESPNLETNPNPRTSPEVRSVAMLQRGHYGHSKIHDGLEVGLGHVQ